MGQRGIIPFPDAERERRGMRDLKNGNGEKVRRLVLPPKAPAPPKGLSRMAAAEWRRVVPRLEVAGVLAEVDRGVLAAYCTSWAHMMEAEELLAAEGAIRPNREGVPVKHPAWQIYREANRTMLAAAAQCYLTPTSRLRIPVPQGAKVDDGDDDTFD